MQALIPLLLALAACGAPPPPVPAATELGWLVGTWTTTDGDLTTTERWAPLPDGALLGSGYLGGEQVLVFAEALAIVDGPDGRALVAWPSRQAPTAFPLVLQGPDEVAFENPAHDFPRRIAYRRTDPDTLEVTASGTRSGAPHEERWTLSRALPAPR